MLSPLDAHLFRKGVYRAEHFDQDHNIGNEHFFEWAENDAGSLIAHIAAIHHQMLMELVWSSFLIDMNENSNNNNNSGTKKKHNEHCKKLQFCSAIGVLVRAYVSLQNCY